MFSDLEIETCIIIIMNSKNKNIAGII